MVVAAEGSIIGIIAGAETEGLEERAGMEGRVPGSPIMAAAAGAEAMGEPAAPVRRVRPPEIPALSPEAAPAGVAPPKHWAGAEAADSAEAEGAGLPIL